MKGKKVIENVEVIDMGTKGKGVAKKDGMVIFVQDAIPGDVVDVEVYKKKKSFYEANVIKYIKRSDDLTEPFCKHFEICGGCSYQHINYDAIHMPMYDMFSIANLSMLAKSLSLNDT